MTTVADAPAPPGAGLFVVRRAGERLLDVMVAVWIASGGFVLFEPSPYELAFVAVLGVALAAGLGLHRSTAGLLLIFVGFMPFALLAAFQVRFTPLDQAIIYAVVTGFLLLTSYFLANYIADNPLPHMRLIVVAYTACATIVALIGTLAYLRLIPNPDLFLRFGRAKATFNDPNVFGPFLILPALYALQRVLLADRRRAILAGLVFLVLFVGVFVSFSRAAWGHLALSALVVFALCFWLETRGTQKLRLIVLAAIGVGVLLLALVALLSIPAVAELFEVRASSQDYDSGETGRFGRQGYAFDLALQNPLGLGPLEFRNYRIMEEPHNTYVNVLHVYGWGGGLIYYAMILTTIWKGVAGVVRPSPYRLLMIPLIACFVPLSGVAGIIDTDHWRHYFLLVGLIWGVSAAIDRAPRTERSAPQDLV